MINLDGESKDIWKWPSKSGAFMSKLYYDSCFSHLVVDPIFKWIWKCACRLKFKVFGWILLMDRLNTRDMMQRRHWIIQDDTCVLCNFAQHEDRAHLSLLATLVKGFGTILGYLGPFNRTKPHMRWLKQLGGISVILFSLRLSSLLLGIFGVKGMGRSSLLLFFTSNLYTYKN